MTKNSKTGTRDYVAIGYQYALDVVAGEIPACQWVVKACQRQIDDLAQEDFPYRFDQKRASDICAFLEMVPHIRGRWKSKTLFLEPWQCFSLTVIFGWVNAAGIRRFRKALIVIPRKNAKTTLAAAIGLYLLALDKEPGAEVYSAATTRDQAKYCWDIAKAMAQRTPGFCDRFGVSPLAHSIAIESESAFFKPLSRDADSLEGLSPHGAIIDELHAHKTREVFDVLDEATGSRRQPLLFIISTEGDNATGVFAEQVSYGEHVLDGRHEDESFFFIFYGIDQGDAWTSPEVWRKANPNIGVSVLENDLEIRCLQAQKNAASQSSFLTKRLNVRVGAGSAFFNLFAWDKLCYDPELLIEQFSGQPCVIGMDLATHIDIAAKVIIFTRDGIDHIFGKYYLPEDSLERGNPNYDVYRGWADDGYLTITTGNVIDFNYIERDLLEDRAAYQILEVGYDQAQATQLATNMYAAAIPMVKVPQNVMQMSEPMKELGSRILAGRVRHDGNPVMTWMLGNVTARIDAKENVYPRKARNENKIDGAVAAIIAMNRKLFHVKDVKHEPGFFLA